MFGMSFVEIGIILVLALVVLGPEKLPQLASMAGRALRELRKATSDLRHAVELEDLRKDMRLQLDNNARRRTTAASADPYAGLNDEESRWQAQTHSGSFFDDDGDDEDAVDVADEGWGESPAEPGALGAQTPDLPPPAGAISAGTLSLADHDDLLLGLEDPCPDVTRVPVPDAQGVNAATTQQTRIKAARLDVLGGVIAVEVSGGVPPLPAAPRQGSEEAAADDASGDDAETTRQSRRRAEGPWLTVALTDRGPLVKQETDAVRVDQIPIAAPPLELLGAVTAAPVSLKHHD